MRTVATPLAAAIAVLLFAGCGTDSSEISTDADTDAASPVDVSGDQVMRSILSEIANSVDEENAYVGRGKMDASRERLANARKAGMAGIPLWDVVFQTGSAELKYGALAPAVEHLQEAADLLSSLPFDRARHRKTYFELGVAWMRTGETQNCCALNSSDSCILPIQGKGLHLRPQGSENAIACFTEVLKHPADNDDEKELLQVDHTSRWLMNIAAMTLGRWPDAVPELHRLDSAFFESNIEFPRFRNVYPDLGLRTFNLCGGAVVDDFNGDDCLDILTCTWDPAGQTQLFLSNRDGTFRETTDEAGLTGLTGGLNLVQADYDNDGDTDVFILRGAWLRTGGQHPNSLLQNDGSGHFTDVTFESGLAEPFAPTKTAAWADYDNDGDLDLYIGNEATLEIPVPSQLFRNNGDSTFTDVAREAGLDEAMFCMGAVWGDYDNDGYADLYVSIEGPNRLYHNNQDGTFTDVAEEAGVTEPSQSFPAWFWDYNNDGNLDIYASCTSGPVGVLVSDIRFDLMHMYRGDGQGSFEDAAGELGLDYPAEPMGANFGDLDHDGYLDFYLATGNVPYWAIRPNVMFSNRSGASFENVTMAGGFGHLQKGHGVSFADIDNDGDQDVYVQLGGAFAGDRFNDALFENPGFGNHWLTVRLEGTTSNRCAIGARIRAVIEENGIERSVYRHVTSGGSFGANPLRQSLGLGTAEHIERLEIYWPASDTTQVFNDVTVDRTVRIVEGEDVIHPVEIPTFRIGE